MTSNINQAYYANKILTIVFIAIICFIALYSFIYIPDYESYQISDWMINYEGGFVRRGLMGQLLLFANTIHTFDVRYAILIIELMSYILFFYLLFRIFTKYKWSLLGAMYPIACSTTSIAIYRRDFMMLCLCYFSYNYFFKYLSNNKSKFLLISIILMSISIIIYEPVFFVLVPVLLLQYWNKEKNILKSLCIFSLPLLCMMLSCIFRGNAKQVDDIWQSWIPYISQYVDIDKENVGLAIQFLGLQNTDVFEMHFKSNLSDNPIMAITTLIIVISLAFYLCTHIPTVNTYNKTIQENINKYELGRILLFQLFIQLPMFTILSCDYGRTIPYSLYTTFFTFHLKKEYYLDLNVTRIISNISNKIMHSLNSVALLNNVWVYMLIILLFPFQIFVPSLLFDNIIVHSYEKIIKYII